MNTPGRRDTRNAFHHFVGENVLRSDLSISVDQLGSLNDHTGPAKDAEDFAAKVFGADMTLFSTNGSSTSNRVILQASVTDKDTWSSTATAASRCGTD